MNLGLKCVGPSILKCEIDEPCPNSAIIDLDTARLLTKKRHASNSHRLHLDCRCITCHAEYRVRECVAKSSLHLQVPGYLCTRPGCSRPCIDGTAGCDLHLLGLSFDSTPQNRPPTSPGGVQSDNLHKMGCYSNLRRSTPKTVGYQR